MSVDSHDLEIARLHKRFARFHPYLGAQCEGYILDYSEYWICMSLIIDFHFDGYALLLRSEQLRLEMQNEKEHEDFQGVASYARITYADIPDEEMPEVATPVSPFTMFRRTGELVFVTLVDQREGYGYLGRILDVGTEQVTMSCIDTGGDYFGFENIHPGSILQCDFRTEYVNVFQGYINSKT